MFKLGVGWVGRGGVPVAGGAGLPARAVVEGFSDIPYQGWRVPEEGSSLGAGEGAQWGPQVPWHKVGSLQTGTADGSRPL